MRATREGFGAAMVELARENPNVVGLCADLAGSTLVNRISEVDPSRFFQIGIAELNMLDVAAGMATCGKIPFATTFAIFGTGRAWEAFRNSICYPSLNVKLVCTHSGLGVGPDGASHQALEDIAVTRAIPNATVIVPADYESSRAASLAVGRMHGPVYVRLGRAKVKDVYADGDCPFEIGKGIVLRDAGDSADVALVACGPTVAMAQEAAEVLAADGINATVVDMHTVKPIDGALLERVAKQAGCVVTSEEHNIVGGLGSACAEYLSQHCPVPMEFVGTRDTFGESGEHDELWKKYGISIAEIVARARRVIERRSAGK